MMTLLNLPGRGDVLLSSMSPVSLLLPASLGLLGACTLLGLAPPVLLLLQLILEPICSMRPSLLGSFLSFLLHPFLHLLTGQAELVSDLPLKFVPVSLGRLRWLSQVRNPLFRIHAQNLQDSGCGKLNLDKGKMWNIWVHGNRSGCDSGLAALV